jgi:hypothetical protein
MQVYINRVKALLLVGTISAGCASTNDDEGPDNPGAAGTAGAGTGGSTPSAGGSGQGAAGAGTGGTPSAGGTGQGGGGIGGTPSAGGSGQSGPDAGNPDADDPDAGDPDAGDPDGADAGGDAGGTLTCDDTASTVVSCDDLGQTECDGLEGFLSSECEMVAFMMKPATANVARNCMIALAPPELCDETNTYTCIVEALGSSCPDPEADDECAIIAPVCDDSSPAFSACSSALSGMTQSGRDQMVQCMTELCDLYACIEGLTTF